MNLFLSHIVRDVYRNIPEVSGDLKDNCKNLFFKKNDGILNSEIKEAGASSDDPLGSQSVTSNRLSSEKVITHDNTITIIYTVDSG